MAATKTYTASLARRRGAGGRGRPRADRRGRRACRRRWRASSTARAPPTRRSRGRGWERLAVVGRGAHYATAFEAALKLRELAGIVAEAYSPADLLHGPIATVGPGFPMLAIAPAGPDRGRDARAAGRCARARRRRGGHRPTTRRSAIRSWGSSPCPSGWARSSPSCPRSCWPWASPSGSGVDVDAPVRPLQDHADEMRPDGRHPTRPNVTKAYSTARARSTTSRSRSATASSWCSSARRAAASRRC